MSWPFPNLITKQVSHSFTKIFEICINSSSFELFSSSEVPEEVFDYESKQICGSEYMKKFGCAHDAVASVFCKETCMNVITQLVKTPVPDSHAPLMSFFQMDGLGKRS